MADPKSKTRADLAAVAEKQAHSLADMAAGFGKATGILVSEMTEFDLFAFSARLAKGAMAACGVLKYLRLETSSVEAAAEFAANCPDPEQAANALKYAEFIDVGTTLLKNFSARGDDQQKAPEPISSGAKRWAAY